MEPPLLAAWMLEHCIPGRRDQALAGDLEEEFQQGRSSGWYWRQALSACAVGWAKYLGDRTSLIVFAVLWSMLAPAWTAIIDRVQNRDVAWPVSVAAWVMLNLAFLWTGMLLFTGLHRRPAVALNLARLKRAFGVAAAVFLPAYFFTFILMNLFAWPGIAVNWRTINPLGEIVDLRVWADALRFPYLVTILWSLWGVTPALAVAPAPLMEWKSQQRGGSREESVAKSRRDPYAVKRMLVLMTGAGLLNALIAGFVLCRLPEAHDPSLSSIALRAALYTAIGAAAGVMGTYVYWHAPASTLRDDPPLPFSLFALVCAAGWVWVPAMVLFSEQVSALTAWVAAIAAFLLSGEIRRIVLLVVPPEQPQAESVAAERNLFAESLYRAPAEPYGFAITLCIYGAGWAFADRSNMTAGALLALGACLFRLKTTFLPNRDLRTVGEYRRAGLRLAAIALPAVLVTVWALLDGVAHRNYLDAVNAARQGVEGSGGHAQRKAEPKSAAHQGSGYESVVLWPYPPRKQVVAPIELTPLLKAGTTQPAVIRFDGQYWYLQPPDEHPGPQTHQAQGTPLDVHIASANSFPLTMEAHQFLRTPIRLARCREIQVEIENRETGPGLIGMAVWLKNSAEAGAPALYLGQQPIAGSAPDEETLAFAVPASGRIRRFDEITVMMLPDEGHQMVGPRIAIEQFELLPR
jgi:hypothetical protein